MPGRSAAIISGKDLQDKVIELATSMGLMAEKEVKLGRRLWGSERKIDVVLTHPKSRLKLGIECKFQKGGGSAEEKIPATIEDIRAWPIRGIVVIGGDGFSANMLGFLRSTGSVVEFEDLADWLKLYFGID